MDSRQPGAPRLVLTLATAGLCSGIVLVGVYLTTKPLIDRNRAEALRAAIFQVLPGSDDIAPAVLEDGGLVPREAGPDAGAEQRLVYRGVASDGELVGYAIPAEGPGFMDTIKLIYGYDPDRKRVVGMEVLESRETPGLGDKIITDEDFRENFRALKLEPEVVPVKRGEKSRPNEVDCITGATISSEAVVSIVNESSDRWLPVLDRASAGRRRRAHDDPAD